MPIAKLKGSTNADVAAMAVRFVRAARESTGLATRAFEQRCGLPLGTVSQIENNRLTHAPKLEILARIGFVAGNEFTIKQDDKVIFQIKSTASKTDLLNRLFTETQRFVIALRAETGLSQKEFAATKGISQGQVSMFEATGKQKLAPVSLETLVKLTGGNPKSIMLAFGD